MIVTEHDSTISDKELEETSKLVNYIIAEMKADAICNDRFIDTEKMFLQLVFLSIEDLQEITDAIKYGRND